MVKRGLNMKIPLQFFVDVNKILLAHENTLDTKQKCDYLSGRDSYGLVYVLDGEAEFRFSSGERITVHKGNSLLISADSAYKIIVKKSFWHYTINFNIHKKTSSIKVLDNPMGAIKNEDTYRFESIFKRLVSAWNGRKTSYEMQCLSILYELLADFYAEYISQNDKSIERIIIAKEYIEQHFNERITLEMLSGLTNMSITNFCREWEKHFEYPPLKYRDSIRLHYAKEYLKTKYYNISEVATKCGFESVNYFVRFFKKHTGVSPGKF